MGKKAGKAPPLDDDELREVEHLSAEDFDWLDDRAKVAAATSESPYLPCGEVTRTLRELEVALLPAVTATRTMCRAIARGQAYSPPDPVVRSVFADYRHYLAELKASVVESGDEPDEALEEYDGCIKHVLGCFDKLLRGEGISRVEALQADAWLKDVPGETLLFN